jgi:hypothetical protein
MDRVVWLLIAKVTLVVVAEVTTIAPVTPVTDPTSPTKRLTFGRMFPVVNGIVIDTPVTGAVVALV